MSRRAKILLIILLFAFLFFINVFGRGELKNSFYLASSPTEKVLFRAGKAVSDFFEALFNTKKLKKENEEVTKQNLILTKQIADLKALEEENKSLRKAFNLGLAEKFELFLVEIVTREIDGDFISISGGRKHGIFENMPVITEEGILVGKVFKSFRSFSKVSLISNKSSVFDIEIFPYPTEAPTSREVLIQSLGQAGKGEAVLGLAKGKGNLGIRLEMVSKEAEVSRGDVAVTTILGGRFPKGLLVGEIIEARKSDVKPFQEGEIDPYFTKVSLNKLFVITNFEGYKEEDTE